MTSHTPTPWELGETKLGDLAIYPKGNQSPICVMMGEDDADATFIVRAVNAHEELVGIVKELYETVQFPGGDGIIRRSHIERMKQAIAKAEGNISTERKEK